MSSALSDLLSLSGAFAHDLDWAQAAGGNASVKDLGLDRLLVKASGQRLSAMDEKQGWVSLKLSATRAALNDPSLESLSHGQQQDETGERLAKALWPDSPPGRASLEAEFHVLGPRLCLHLHLVEALALLCLEDAPAIAESMLRPYGLDYAWADFRPPGHSLARQVALGFEKAPGVKLALMRNHGPIFWGDAVEEVLQRARTFRRILQRAFPPVVIPSLGKAADLNRATEALAFILRAGGVARTSKDPWVASLALGGAWSWQALCPDDFIYCGTSVPTLTVADALDHEKLLSIFGSDSTQAAVAVEGQGVVLAAREPERLRAMEELLYANAKARALARGLGKVRALRAAQGAEILGMRGEKYRQNVGGGVSA